MAGKSRKQQAAKKKPAKQQPAKKSAAKAKSAAKKPAKARAKKPAKKPAKAVAKKGAAKKPAKKPAVKAAAKKPAAKKPAVKKPAVKKPAVKKPAVKHAEPAPVDIGMFAEAAPTEAVETAMFAVKASVELEVAPPTEAVETGSPIEVVEAGEVVAAAPAAAPSLRDEILAMARQLYGDRSDDELLAFDPNDIDAMDPSMFYELVGEKYGIAPDPNNDYFGGFGGPIAKLIAFVESRWDGKTRKDTPMPPGDWLEEYVHPES